MTIYDTLNILAFGSLVAAGVVPLIIAVRVKVSSIRILSLLLGAFALSHGIYHLSFVYGQSFLADVFLEPLSVVSLVSFGLYYLKKGAL